MNELDVINQLYGQMVQKEPALLDLQQEFAQITSQQRVDGIYRFSTRFLVVVFFSGDFEVVDVGAFAVVKHFQNEDAFRVAPSHVFCDQNECYLVFAQSCLVLSALLTVRRVTLRASVCGYCFGSLVDKQLNPAASDGRAPQAEFSLFKRLAKKAKRRIALVKSSETVAVVCYEDNRLFWHKKHSGLLLELEFPFCNPQITDFTVYERDILVYTKNDAVVHYELQLELTTSSLTPQLSFFPHLIRTSSMLPISADILSKLLFVGNCGPFEDFYTMGILVGDRWLNLPGSGRQFRFVQCFQAEKMVVLAGETSISFLQFAYKSQPREGFRLLKDGTGYRMVAPLLHQQMEQKSRLSQRMSVALGSPNYSFMQMSQNPIDSQTYQAAPFAGLYASQDFVDIGGISMLDGGRADDNQYRQSGLL